MPRAQMKFASGKFALGICDRCGGTFKLSSLKEERIKRIPTGNLVCEECYDPDHPQNFFGECSPVDATALRRHRPDRGRASSRGLLIPLRGQGMFIEQGPFTNNAASLSGMQLSAVQGAILSLQEYALTGASLALDQGSFSISPNELSHLSGQVLTASAGALVSTRSRTLTGQPATASAGTLDTTASPTLTGQEKTMQLGSLVAAPARGLTGAGATASTGTLTAAGATTDPRTTGQEPVLYDDDVFTGSKWSDPCVIAEDGGYTMWILGSNMFADFKIFRFRSTDKINWTATPTTPVVSPGATGEWDSGGAETPSVVYYGGSYHMFYTGYNGAFSDIGQYRIGYATSTDGITWTKHGVFLAPTGTLGDPPTGDFRQYVVAEPGAVVVGDKLYLYFAAIGYNTALADTMQVIGLTVFDPSIGTGGDWTAPAQVVLPNQVMYPKATYYGFSTPAPCIDPDGNITLFCSLAERDPYKQVRIINITSADGETGWSDNTYPVIYNSDASWSSSEVIGAWPLTEGTQLHLWWGGNNGFNLGIGYKRLV